LYFKEAYFFKFCLQESITCPAFGVILAATSTHQQSIHHGGAMVVLITLTLFNIPGISFSGSINQSF